MTSEIYVIGFETTTTRQFDGRFESAQKRQLVSDLVQSRPHNKNTTPTKISDDLGTITDKTHCVTIQTAARVYVRGVGKTSQTTVQEILPGSTAKIALVGYGKQLEENAVIGLRKIR